MSNREAFLFHKPKFLDIILFYRDINLNGCNKRQILLEGETSATQKIMVLSYFQEAALFSSHAHLDSARCAGNRTSSGVEMFREFPMSQNHS